MVLSHEGIMSDPKKTEALSNLPFPSNVKEMQSFLGMCNYLGRLTSWFTSLSTPPRQFIKKANAFTPMPQHNIAFQAIIDEIYRNTTLITTDLTLT